MSASSNRVKNYIQKLLEKTSLTDLIHRISPKNVNQVKLVETGYSKEHIMKRLAILPISEEEKETLIDKNSLENHKIYAHNIENYIGTVKVPVGLAGPIQINGLFAQGLYLLPLATTEAALVASYNRGAKLITCAGGCSAMLLNEGVSRAPGFVFNTLTETGQFIVWVETQIDRFKEEVKKTTKHGELIDMKLTLEGNHVYLNFEYYTGDASGQNMVTIATDQVCKYIVKNSPIKPKNWFIEANMSGDKKASFQSFQSVRGKKVTAELIAPASLVKQLLHTTPKKLVEYWQLSAIGGSLSGTIGMQGHYSNGLAALYCATGQDVACVSESSIGLTRLEVTEKGDLYASVNLPNLMVATVGGGTSLPSQHANLGIMGLPSENSARAFAEIAAGLCLAGELSIMGALCAGDFTKAHYLLARVQKQ